MLPSEAPAPTMVCSSSMNRMVRPLFFSSSMAFLIRSSNSPRYLVPASIPPRSKVTTRLFFSSSGMLPLAIRWARPSIMALLPTPGSPMSTGLFFVRRDRIWMIRWISFSRPITGSSSPSRARRVRSLPYWFSTGVSGSPASWPAPLGWAVVPESICLSRLKSQPRSSRIRTATQSRSRRMASRMCSVPM